VSLFICENCKTVENTACVDRNVDTNKDYPNLHMMEMQGHGNDDIAVNQYFKKASDILMLCSECNTGIWHGEFDKRTATVDEEKLSMFSKYNMITPYDHPEGSIFKDYTKPHGYGVNPHSNEVMSPGCESADVEIIFEQTQEDRGIHITSNKKMMLAGLMGLAASFDNHRHRSEMSRGIPLINNLRRLPSNEKFVQSDKDKLRMVERAAIKRQIKTLKKDNGDKSLLIDLERKYKEMR
jgi:hypothetical protein